MYRREDLAQLSTAVDRHLHQLLSCGRLKKLAQGLYYAPRQSSLGPLPPDDAKAVGGFLRDRNFLIFSPSAYNTLGLGTTQLYNRTLVYNHKRHGVFKLGNRQFDFRVKRCFPKKLTPEFLYIDLLNNLDELAEDHNEVLAQAQRKLHSFDRLRLQRAVTLYASMATRRRLETWGHSDQISA
ncbi:hypothetical protein AGMMS49545_09960 [Betaproteobacteria bacterium]|nr:hypothetical protein AGMMS49545_09960 [Betaproteobacteria bacterium]GHU45690.1 hypothetical protein AGMMS50289_17390 [Betaproteobacteria bacterium]